ncbi:MAG: TonB family protein, partial [Acidobacteriota bacterium]
MKSQYFEKKNSRLTRISLLFALVLMIGALPLLTAAQVPELSLADLLIGLRSKKVSLEDRNKILSEAVRQRGITFSITPEIEKELITTGADVELIGAIRDKSQPPPVVKPVATPVPTPTTPDFSFYKVRAETSAGKGDFTTALADYNKSLELKSDSSAVFFSRGQTYLTMKLYDLAVADFGKAIELNPNDSTAYFGRGFAYERLNQPKKAVADYAKAVEIDGSNESAKTNLKRLQDEEAKAVAVSKPPVTVAVPTPEPVKPPEYMNLGALNAASATRMVTPSYSPIAQKSGVEGRVTVEVELDTEGNVVKAKAVSGHAMLRKSAESAAERSKFKPATFENR